MTRPACKRCAEPLVLAPPKGLCIWCEQELELKAVGTLVSLATDSSDWARSERAAAIDALRSLLAYTKQQVLHARAQAFDGHSVEQILEGLRSAAAPEMAEASA